MQPSWECRGIQPSEQLPTSGEQKAALDTLGRLRRRVQIRAWEGVGAGRVSEVFLEEVTIEHPTLRISRGLSCRCYRQRENMTGRSLGLSCDKEKILRCSKLKKENC